LLAARYDLGVLIERAPGFGLLTNVTRNRRAGESPYVTSTTIDPNLGIIRVDDLKGNAIATLWNFAIHGFVRAQWPPTQRRRARHN